MSRAGAAQGLAELGSGIVGMRKLVITLIVLAVVFVIVDRVTHSTAQRQVAREVANTYDLQSQPEVRIRGFPFLTQALRGHYRQIDLTAQNVAVRDLRIRQLEVEFADVDAPPRALLQRDVSEIRAGTVNGSAVVAFSELQRRLPGDMDVRAQGEDLQLSGEATVLGRTVPVTAVVAVAAQERTITFRPTRIEVGGRGGGSLLQDQLTFRFSLEELPLRLRPTGVQVTDGGVRVSATADSVALTQTTRP